jgi:hypothetical protein
MRKRLHCHKNQSQLQVCLPRAFFQVCPELFFAFFGMLRMGMKMGAGVGVGAAAFTISSNAQCTPLKERVEEMEHALACLERKTHSRGALAGDTVLITGATAGIGAACAWRFAEEGCNVIITGRRKVLLDELKAKIEAKIPDAKVFAASLDVSSVDAVVTFPSKLPSAFSEVDILVNNAGCALGVEKADEAKLRYVVS